MYKLSVFEIWDKIGRRTPFAARRSHWDKEYYAIIETIDLRAKPQKKAFGYAMKNDECSDAFSFSPEWRESKLIPGYQHSDWRIHELAPINKPFESFFSMNYNVSKLYNPSDILDFGKYKGKTVAEILKQDPRYIIWLLINTEKFKLSEHTMRNINYHSSFVKISESVIAHTMKK